MALLTESDIRAAALGVTRRTYKTADSILRESVASVRSSYDVFLSHSRLDSELVLGVKEIIESTGQTVYVDWIDDPYLDRSNVTPATAQKLRERMRQSRSLFYAHSGNATKSRWMPWEMGYFDGFNGNVAIFPIVQSGNQTTYKGEEFLGLYPYVDVTGRTVSQPGSLYIHRNSMTFMRMNTWRESADKLRPTI